MQFARGASNSKQNHNREENTNQTANPMEILIMSTVKFVGKIGPAFAHSPSPLMPFAEVTITPAHIVHCAEKCGIHLPYDEAESALHECIQDAQLELERAARKFVQSFVFAMIARRNINSCAL